MRKLAIVCQNNEIFFVLTTWFVSRLFIVVMMGIIAPLVPESIIQLDPRAVPEFTPSLSWDMFAHFDGGAYLEIASSGYNYADGRGNVVWFPLFPLLIKGATLLGIPLAIAGPLVNNLAFLGALYCLYYWSRDRYDIKVARWTVIAVALCPFSLFGTIAYTEGLFLLNTTIALWSFDAGKYGRAAFWGALASATRVPGIVLMPAFLFIAWKERRSKSAYAAGVAVSIGLLLFVAYCSTRFGDPLAFVHGQKAWSEAASSFKVIRQLLNFVMIAASGFFLWRLSRKLSPVVVTYGFFYLIFIAISGAVVSVNRFLYGCVPLLIVLGLFLAYSPRWRISVISVFMLSTIIFSIRFAWRLWVA